MNRHHHAYRTRMLGSMILLAAVYVGLLWQLPTLTGVDLLDGIIGVVLGLYICAPPAANMLNLLFQDRGIGRQVASAWIIELGWLGLNLLVLLIGWFVVFLGIMRLVW